MSKWIKKAQEEDETPNMEGLEDIIEQMGQDVVESALKCDVEPENIEEAYQGQYSSDEDFTKQLLEDVGTIPSDLPWYVHIDWEQTARDIMMDYCESNGHYFRSL